MVLSRAGSILVGPGAMVVSALFFGIMGFAAKFIAPQIPPLESVFVRGASGTMVLYLIVKWRGGDLWGTHRLELTFRGAVGTLAAFAYFFSVTLAPAAEATALFRGSALFMPFLAYLLIKERLTFGRVAYAALGFAGTLLILKPGFSHMQLGLWIAIIGAFVNAAGWVAVRSLSQKESTATIIFYFTLFSALGALVLGAHSFVAPNAQQALWLVVVGAAGIVGQYFLTIAYRHADAAVVTPLGYTEVFAMLALAWFFFDEIPDALSWAGIALITLAGILVSRPEKA